VAIVNLFALTAFAQSVTKVALADATVVSGMPTTGTVTISTPAPTGGYKVTMLYGPYGLGPATVTVAAAQTTATFKLTAKTVSTTRTESVLAQGADNSSVATSCLVIPPTVQKLEMTSAFVMAGQSTTATLTLTGIPVTSGLIVNLTSSDPNFTVPATVTVAWPRQTAIFPVNALGGIGSIKATTITASYGKDKVSATLTAIPNNLPAGFKPGVYQCRITDQSDAWLNYERRASAFPSDMLWTIIVHPNGAIQVNRSLFQGSPDNRFMDLYRHWQTDPTGVTMVGFPWIANGQIENSGLFRCYGDTIWGVNSLLKSDAQRTLVLKTFSGSIQFNNDGTITATIKDLNYTSSLESGGTFTVKEGTISGTYTLKPTS
jgi:hypothetical protein